MTLNIHDDPFNIFRPDSRHHDSPVSVAAGPDRMLWTSEQTSYVTSVDEDNEELTRLNVGTHNLGQLLYSINQSLSDQGRVLCYQIFVNFLSY